MYSVLIRENADQQKSEYGHFSCSVIFEKTLYKNHSQQFIFTQKSRLISTNQLYFYIRLLSAKPTIWSDLLKQFVGFLRTNFLSLFDDFVGLALKGLSKYLFPRIKKKICAIQYTVFYKEKCTWSCKIIKQH